MKIQYKNLKTIDYVCALCGEKFKNSYTFSTHLSNKHSIQVKEYYDKHIKHDNEGICPICKKDTNFSGKLSLGYNKYCSRACAAVDRAEEPSEPFTCKICQMNIMGKYVSTQAKNVNKHLNITHHITPQEYYDRFLKSTDEGTCKFCGKPTPFANIRDGYRPTCSAACALKSIKNKHIEENNKFKEEQLNKTLAYEALCLEIKNRAKDYDWVGDRNTILFGEVDLTKSDYHANEEYKLKENNSFNDFEDYPSDIFWI